MSAEVRLLFIKSEVIATSARSSLICIHATDTNRKYRELIDRDQCMVPPLPVPVIDARIAIEHFRPARRATGFTYRTSKDRFKKLLISSESSIAMSVRGRHLMARGCATHSYASRLINNAPMSVDNNLEGEWSMVWIFAFCANERRKSAPSRQIEAGNIDVVFLAVCNENLLTVQQNIR
ncbi:MULTISPECIES: hypothetical protein [unclassified Bradyrhizobium]|uniref:hypothetical protein n=2 Tax=Bradyrhizobium TaxID=374 RepID=UPI0020A20CD7|nr:MULTISPECIES: hypothetical protein [unclassified Bradyrhizobium]MCP1838718.1 hypothetical protein [Bradyrhizobium sp. USDA 4538]